MRMSSTLAVLRLAFIPLILMGVTGTSLYVFGSGFWHDDDNYNVYSKPRSTVNRRASNAPTPTTST
ncbi:hypothetical protein PINS_up017530 [Pythium insidiosum]|nr:hypothetical protein PINS_up017530 [Pythium insidiosum]